MHSGHGQHFGCAKLSTPAKHRFLAVLWLLAATLSNLAMAEDLNDVLNNILSTSRPATTCCRHINDKARNERPCHCYADEPTPTAFVRNCKDPRSQYYNIALTLQATLWPANRTSQTLNLAYLFSLACQAYQPCQVPEQSLPRIKPLPLEIRSAPTGKAFAILACSKGAA